MDTGERNKQTEIRKKERRKARKKEFSPSKMAFDIEIFISFVRPAFVLFVILFNI